MKMYDLRVLFPDNGGICLHIVPTKTKAGKLYIATEMTPQAIGELLLTLQADMRLDASDVPNLDDIEF